MSTRRRRYFVPAEPDAAATVPQPIPPELWLHRLYGLFRGRGAATMDLGFADGRRWSIRVCQGFPSAYAASHPNPAWRTGALLQRTAHLDDASIDRALAAQRRDGLPLGETVVALGLVPPAAVQRTLRMQLKGVLRELFLAGPPVHAELSQDWPREEGAPLRVVPSRWLLTIARQRGRDDRLLPWGRAWSGHRFCAMPPFALRIDPGLLTPDEHRVLGDFSDPRGQPLGLRPPRAAVVLAAAGLLDPVQR